jgi:hypothetical protein
MIAYTLPITSPSTDFSSALLALIAAHDTAEGRGKPWPERSAAALQKFLADPNAKKLPAIWSEVKPVYVRLQYGKCAFCERLLGADEVAAYESDVEHFRPKKGVVPWPPAAPIGYDPYPTDFPATPGKGAGYRNLPYHELNYMVACKTCNTRCKGNYFPVAQKHRFTAADPLKLRDGEQPYLIFPLGGLDDDPETLITFIDCKAVPARPSSDVYAWNRARITIAFFLLNDPSREDQLILERASRLDLLGSKIEKFEASSEAERAAAWGRVIAEGSATQPHANCVRSMIRLYLHDPAKAHEQIAKARTYRESKLPLSGWAAKQPGLGSGS